MFAHRAHLIPLIPSCCFVIFQFSKGAGIKFISATITVPFNPCQYLAINCLVMANFKDHVKWTLPLLEALIFPEQLLADIYDVTSLCSTIFVSAINICKPSFPYWCSSYIVGNILRPSDNRNTYLWSLLLCFYLGKGVPEMCSLSQIWWRSFNNLVIDQLPTIRVKIVN